MADIDSSDGFLTRWSRRKASARQGQPTPDMPAAAPTAAAPGPSTSRAPAANPPAATQQQAPASAAILDETSTSPPPTLDEVARLTPNSDFRRFVAPQVAPEVRNAALKQLFADPRFNVMDGLDIYIDDYGKPDPLPIGMLRKLAQAEFLNLFADAKKPGEQAPAAADAPAEPSADEDAALRLQPHDPAGPPGAGSGAGEDTGGER